MLIVSAFFASAVLVVPAMVEPFMLPKATAVVIVSIVLGALFCLDVALSRRLRVPVSGQVFAVGALAVCLVLVTVTSTDSGTSLFGWYGRYTGLLPYLAYLTLFLAVVATAGPELYRFLRRTGLVALGVVVSYGLLQAVGADPISWLDNGLGAEFSTLGNVDFAAAWAGAVSALAAATLWSADESTSWRGYAGGLLPLTGIYLVATGTSQGVVVALVALSWVVLVMGTQREGAMSRLVQSHRRATLTIAGAVAVTLVAVLVTALPFLRAQLDQAFVERPEFWMTAVRIFVDHPLAGTGLDTFGHHFLAYRPASHALANSTAGADAPHSVPLGMFSNGGLLLGVSYLFAVALVGVALVRGLLGGCQADRAVLAGFGGVWVGYQAQSLVSYDVPSLALLHWLSAAVIVAVAAPPGWREFRLPGPVATRAVTKRGRNYGPTVTPVSSRVLQGVVILSALVAVWFAVYPLRADLVAASAAPLGRTGQLDAAIGRLERASTLNPAEASYPYLTARAQHAAGRPQAALDAAAEAALRDSGGVQYSLFAAQSAASAGDVRAASRWYRESVARDPKDPVVLTAVAHFFVEQGKFREARDYIESALAVDPENAAARQELDLLSREQPAG